VKTGGGHPGPGPDHADEGPGDPGERPDGHAGQPSSWPAGHEAADPANAPADDRSADFTDTRASHGPSDGEQEERALIIARLAEQQRGLGRFFARDRSMPLMASNLTMQQLKVVMLLSVQESASGQELARHLGVALGTVTGIVDRVVAHGLVSRREDPHDRRIRRVELTETGRQLTAEILDAGTAGYRRLLEHLDTETLRTMEKVMRKVREVMRRLHAEAHAEDHHHC
jgi:DNA-binding MarR family transcriptional regulator